MRGGGRAGMAESHAASRRLARNWDSGHSRGPKRPQKRAPAEGACNLLSRTTINSAKARLPVALLRVIWMPVAVPARGWQLTVTNSPAR